MGELKNRSDIHTNPVSAQSSAIDKIIMDFISKNKADQPVDQTSSVIVSEGDRQPAREVAITDLVGNPQVYDGKRVAITGYHHGEFEGSFFCDHVLSAETSKVNTCLWFGGASAMAEPKNVTDENDVWLKVEGIFFNGPTGHMAQWPGEITRMTRMEVVAPPG